MEKWLAHSAPTGGQSQSLSDHLRTVSQMASSFAAPLGFSEEAALAGILHDCGKYGEKFQARLKGKAQHIDHWSFGAWKAVHLHAIGAALAIQGHHVGLDVLSTSKMRENMDPNILMTHHPLSLTLSEASFETVMQRFESDGLQALPPRTTVVPNPLPAPNASLNMMLDVRMLYSCLVDADFLDTEAHFHQDADGHKVFRQAGPALHPEQALSLVMQRLASLESAGISSALQQIRHEVWTQALQAGNEPDGFRTLTAPTGAGKTLAMLAYALQQASVQHKDRIIVVLPYLTIIEQTAKIYRDLFAMFGSRYIVEHHSLADYGDTASLEGSARLLAENWDAPIIITTTVQLFESLFSNRPSRCRKLHNLANSVILLDEVQSLPLSLAIPIVANLSALSQRYHTTVVFATATQPAFDNLSDGYAQISQTPCQFREIINNPPELFAKVHRFHTEFREAPQSWAHLAEEMLQQPACLAMVNLKQHAAALAAAVAEQKTDELPLFHLSTNMCPAHRTDTLAAIKKSLEGDGCRVVATQCIEAGVDVDFPTVYRAWAPADSLAQAAGRCNREGSLPDPGRFIVFQPPEDRYPPGIYQQATSITRAMYREGILDLHHPDSFSQYWRRLYEMNRPGETYRALLQEIRSLDFPAVDRDYRLIDRTTLSVLVPYHSSSFEELATDVRVKGFSQDWVRRAQSFSVNIYRPREEDPIWEKLEPIYARHEKTSWYIYLAANDYSPIFGLMPTQSDVLIS